MAPTSPTDIPELGKDAVNWIIQKGLNTMSIGLAMHYYEIQKSWQFCGSDYMCKLEKLMLYFTAIFGGTSPAIAISELAESFVNKAWAMVQTGDKPLMGKDSWGPTAINMMIYIYIEYILTLLCDWVRYSTECLKQNVCENDNILVWIYNMKARYCNKTETDVDVDVELDCLEGECLDKDVDVPDVVYKITDNSDWCVIFFNELPLLMLAILIWSAYIASVHFKEDIEKVRAAKGKMHRRKGDSGESGSGTVGKRRGRPGRKKKGSGSDEGTSDSGDESSGDDKQGSDSGKEESDSGTEKGGTEKKKRSYNRKKRSSDTKKEKGTSDTKNERGSSDTKKEKGSSDTKKERGGSDTKKEKGSSDTKKGDSSDAKSGRARGMEGESSSAGTQKVVAKCPTCGKVRDMCMPNPLPVYCDKCGPKVTSEVKKARSTDDGGFNKCRRQPKPPKSKIRATYESSDESESDDDLSTSNEHFMAQNSTKGLSLAVVEIGKIIGDLDSNESDSDQNESSEIEDGDYQSLYINIVNLANAQKNELSSTFKSYCLMCGYSHFVHDHDEDSLNEEDTLYA